MADYIFLLQIVDDTIVDGPGFRLSLYASGCTHHCPECHNPQSWNIDNGKPYSIDMVMQRILKSDSNITFTGGDPFFQAEAFIQLAKRIKEETNKTIWCYTGYVFEELIRLSQKKELLNYIDVLVDGKFIDAQKDTNLLFRGSANQRLIDIPNSLKKMHAVIYNYNPFPEF